MRTAILTAIGALLATSAMAQSADPRGIYLSETGRTRVQVSKCGSSYCGKIISVIGQTQDVNNPDPAKRSRGLVGLQMIWDIKPAEEGFTGQLYNFRDGKVYAGKATFEGEAMRLTGCILGGLICRSQVWTRAN